MHIDLSPLLKTGGERRRQRPERRLSGFVQPVAFALPEISERSKRVANRHIETTPYRILDAPGLIDDYYLNLLDWSENKIAVGLGDTLYLYNTETKEAVDIFTAKNDYISAVKARKNKVYIGDAKGSLHIYDLEKETVESRSHHTTRLCSIALSDRALSTGERNGLIVNIDTRCSTVSKLRGHTQEVCGLKWSNDCLASGSNDNTVRIWKQGSPVSRILKGHSSAVKAMDWCPWKRSILATGGGAKDKSIRFWDVATGKCIKSLSVSSQVCSLHYLKRYKEIITGHGFQENDLRLWQGEMNSMRSFGSHEGRILHTTISPDECSVVSLGSDGSLKFWKIAEPVSEEYKRDSIGMR